MKTQTITFSKDGKVVAKAIGKFDVVGDKGSVTWEGEWVENPPASFKNGLPCHGYGGAFIPAMQQKAEVLGLKTEVSEDGGWISYED
jgi:hypothetical protein